jgi:hypothetical protein
MDSLRSIEHCVMSWRICWRSFEQKMGGVLPRTAKNGAPPVAISAFPANCVVTICRSQAMHDARVTFTNAQTAAPIFRASAESNAQSRA